MSKVANHLHRYRKVNLARNGKNYIVYKCQKPACSHFTPIQLAEGKLCECNRCGEPMIIGKTQLTRSSGGPMARPHCNDCVERKGKQDVEALAKFLAEKT